MKAILYNILAWAILPFMDVIAKYLSTDLPDKPSPYIAKELSFISFDVFINYRNFNVANPINAKIIAIIQNLITTVDSGQPFFSK